MRWGILGTAEISVQLIAVIRRSTQSEVKAVASRDPNRARRWAEQHGIPLSFGRYEDLLRSDQVDLIYNPLPNTLHAEWTLRALEAGFPVLCEKPLTADALQAEEVRAVSMRTGLYVAEAFMYRFHPIYDKVFELLRKGTIGKVTTIHSQFTFLLEDRSATPASSELAGGALMDVGCYCVNLSRMIAECEPSRVSAFERRSTVDDVLVGLLDFPNGILAQFESGIACAERHRAEVTGTSGSIVLKHPWHPGDDEAEVLIRRWGEPDERIPVKGENPYFLEVEDFVSVCKKEKNPRWTLQDAVNNMAVIDALFESARTGRAVNVKTPGS